MIGDWVEIGGLTWRVRVVAIEESFTILYSENNGRTLGDGAPMILDPLGTFIGHKVSFARQRGHETDFDALYEFLATPRYGGFPIKIVHGQDVIEYDAYVSGGGRAIKQIDERQNVVKWETLDVQFTPVTAQVIPS